MNILLDFVTFKWQTGAGEYARRVYQELIVKVHKELSNKVHLYGLYDSTLGIAYEDMQSEKLTGIQFVDIAVKPLSFVIRECNIDVLFVACAQYLGNYSDLSNVRCRTICIIHDLAYEEMFTNSITYYFKLLNPKYSLGKTRVDSIKYLMNTLKIVKWFIETRRKRLNEKGLALLQPTIELVRNNKNVQIVTVSKYTRSSLFFHYNIAPEHVRVLSSPERIYSNTTEEAENLELKKIIAEKKRYYLMVSANRNSKNPEKAVNAFKRYAEIDENAYFLVIGYPKKVFDRMINLPYLSDNDLALAFRYCYALVYPSFFEGFGYPPIEAMRYGKPVLTSNTTSIPEILEDAPIYFSPLYETEIFNALTKLRLENYSVYSEKAKLQYAKVRRCQENDLKELISLILDEK